MMGLTNVRNKHRIDHAMNDETMKDTKNKLCALARNSAPAMARKQMLIDIF